MPWNFMTPPASWTSLHSAATGSASISAIAASSAHRFRNAASSCRSRSLPFAAHPYAQARRLSEQRSELASTSAIERRMAFMIRSTPRIRRYGNAPPGLLESSSDRSAVHRGIDGDCQRRPHHSHDADYTVAASSCRSRKLRPRCMSRGKVRTVANSSTPRDMTEGPLLGATLDREPVHLVVDLREHARRDFAVVRVDPDASAADRRHAPGVVVAFAPAKQPAR